MDFSMWYECCFYIKRGTNSTYKKYNQFSYATDYYYLFPLYIPFLRGSENIKCKYECTMNTIP